MFSFSKPYITIKIVILSLLFWGWILDHPKVDWTPLATLVMAVVLSIAALRWVDKKSRKGRL